MFADSLIRDGLLKFVVVDEVHLFTHFGRTFRSEFNDLKDGLFSKLPSSMPMLFLTATCTHAIDAAFQVMIGKSITRREWPIPSIMSMGNRRTAIHVTYSSRMYGNMFKSIASIQTEPDELDLLKKVIVK
jgi:superfamily II DNA helicase RecQ